MEQNKQMEDLLARVEKLEQAVFGKNGAAGSQKTRLGASDGQPVSHKCPDILALLWRNGSFKKALALPEIKEALAGTGHSFTTANILMGLSRVKFLTRHGRRGAFSWQQKYPHHD